jgi:hypothetical protein
VAGMSKHKVEEPFWDTINLVRADLVGMSRKQFLFFGHEMEKIGRGDATFRP